MRQLQARICHGAGSIHLVVPENDFKSLGGKRGMLTLLIEVMPENRQYNRNRLKAHEQMARYREILKMDGLGLSQQEILEKVHVSRTFVSAVLREYGSYGLNTMRTHLSRYASGALEKVFGLHNPELEVLQKAIEAEPIWRVKMLPHSTLLRVREVESFCQEQGFRIEPAISGNNCAGLTVKSYDKVRILKGGNPKAGDIKALIEWGNLDSVFAEDLDFGRELHAFYDYKATRKWL
jgi:hypothetical protein